MSIHDQINNICLLSDSYKVSHWKQTPENTSIIDSYLEARLGAKWDKVVFFGLQYYLQEYLVGPVVTKEKIDFAEEFYGDHFGTKDVFPRDKWEHILYKHGGHLPVEIRAIEEGTVVDINTALIRMFNTDDKCWWLTNYLETLNVQPWYPMTVATQSREMKKIIHSYLVKTGNPDLIGYKLHDFGFRGVTCPEQAAIGGCAHLVNFFGTDTPPACVLARFVYNEKMAGHSIPASEHSTITSWGKKHEVDAMRNMLIQYPTGLVACVSDSFDQYHACEEYWGGELRDLVLARDGVLIVRPDSGDPPTVCCKLTEILARKFGCTTNEKGYRVLHPKVRLIQGDGIDFDMLGRILSTYTEAGWSADNLGFGSGGGLLQKINRDTQKVAFKCSYAVVDGVGRDVFKDPIDARDKKSKKGLLKTIWTPEGYRTVAHDAPGEDVLRTVYRNGHLVSRTSLARIRELAAI